jgi:hypothetical protein
MKAVRGSLEDRLRALPGVLDCSLTDAGVALLVHPEVDARVLQARAHAVFAELGDPRPLMIMGGLAPTQARRVAGVMRLDATPLSLTVFTVLVLCLLALIPLAPRPGSDGGGQAAEAPLGQLEIASSLTPELFRPAAAVVRTRRPAVTAEPAVEVAAPPAPAPAVVDEKAKPARGRPAAKPRRPAASRRPIPAQLAPSISVTAPCTPGRSGGHRVAVKAPLPKQAKGVACD